ncbi:Pentatricopeptide repeat-containing protein, mitochondrial [Vitis vinifera]|uniref:Pentatricopeptide repeat-containing protein, mitochondrial n=1 Tax=Vitis vinifera TaxID=29760 RepID=A0A438KD64_VITVI|nr:Pentatricopeptide repeat-containing protein, mitochondrial [Vitis vinifera]
MIMGFSHHGLTSEALKVFEAMLTSGTHPNSVPFWAFCQHVTMQHYVCMVNLLGRAGKVEEAEEFILKLPFEPDLTIWGALLGVCGFGMINTGVARRAAKRLLELDPLNAPAHVVLCNIHASIGQRAEEGQLRKEMGLKGVRKVPGCSWILLKGEPYVFLSGDRIHPQADEMLSLLFGTEDESR